jgi:hypothetical protein
MTAAGRIRSGLAAFLGGRLISGLLGVAWLALLVRTLTPSQCGVYFGAQALFELLQLASSLGVYGYAGRYLPGAWVGESRSALGAAVLRLTVWRLVTLLLAATAVGWAWPFVVPFLDWPQPGPGAEVFMGYLVAAGAGRLIELIFESGLQQGWIQALSTVRNVLRILAVLTLDSLAAPPNAEWVIGLEALVACMFVLVGTARLGWMVNERPVNRQAGLVRPRGLRAFTLQGYLSVLLAQLCGIDAIKLILSHSAGPPVLAVFGLAVSLADTLARYMPAGLLYGYARAVLTAQADTGASTSGPLPAASLLLRLNGAFLGLALVGLLVFGDVLLHRLAPKLAIGVLMACTASLVLLLNAQALRLMASLLAHVRSDNRSILWANVATLPVPLLVSAVVPAWGLAGAVLGAWSLELIYTGVTLRATAVTACQLWGPSRFWTSVATATGVSAAVGGLVRIAMPAEAGVAIGVPLMALAYAPVLWRLRPLEEPEWQMLKRLLTRRAGA